MGVIAPEGAVTWVDRELDILPTRPQDRFDITPEQIRELREEIFPYWRGKTLEDIVADARAGRRHACRARQGFLAQPDRPRPGPYPARRGELAAAWASAGLRAQVQEARQSSGDGRRQSKQVFYDAAAIVLTAAQDADRTLCRAGRRIGRQEARPAAGGRADADRRHLPPPGRTMPAARPSARRCRRSGSSLCFCRSSRTPAAFRPGAFDQYMLPYLERDLQAGRLTLAAGAGTAGGISGSSSTRSFCCAAAAARATLPAFPSASTSPLGGQLS